MILCLGLVLLVSWALYLVAFKTLVSEDQIGDANKQYDLNMSPSSSDIIQVQNFPAKDIPKTGKYRDSSRLIIVGDVHGMLNELTALLDKVQFDKNSDHLILAGDLISKGPDSPGVVDLAMSLGATAVRGNHEDHILAAHAAMSAKTKLSNNLEENMSGKNARYHALAKRLGNKRIQWLKKCPIILRVGKLGDMGEVVVVHAGLEPGVKLEEQDSYMAMNMRTISVDGVPSDKHMGVGWIKVFQNLTSIGKNLLNLIRIGINIRRAFQKANEQLSYMAMTQNEDYGWNSIAWVLTPAV